MEKVQIRIPLSIKIFTWILIAAGVLFFYVFTFEPSICFPQANLDSYSARLGFGSTGIRIIVGVVILCISLISNKPNWLFITLLGRVFVEIGDIILGTILDGFTLNMVVMVILVTSEIWAVIRLWRHIK